MKSFRILILLTLILSSLGLQHCLAQGSDRQEYNSGLIAMKKGNFRDALQHFSKAAEINPGEYKYYNDRGVAYKRLGDLERALADYNKCLEINPHYTNALNNRGVIYLEQGRYDDALADFHLALRNGGLEGKILTNIGIAKAAKGDYRAAIKDFDNAVSIRPVDPRSFLFMGQSLEHLGDKDKALKMYQVALGVIKEPQIIAVIEKKISALDRSSSENQLPKVRRSPKTESEKSSKATEKFPAKSVTPPIKRTREVVLANRRPDYIEQIVKQNVQKPVETKLPESLDVFNKKIRDRIIGQLSPASAEIMRQALDFVQKSDDHKAMVRFEDVRQLEKRNKNFKAAGWALLETARLYALRGDYLKAEELIGNSIKIFSTLKAPDEKILALVELARVKELEKSTDKSKILFAQAQELANTSGHLSLARVIKDLSSGALEQHEKKLARTKSVVTTAKTPTGQNLLSDVKPAPRVQPVQATSQIASKAIQISNTPLPKIVLDRPKSVFDMSPQAVRQQNSSLQPSISSSKTNAAPNSKILASSQKVEQKSESKDGVTAPSASMHPDAMKPLAGQGQKRLLIERVDSKNDSKPSIDGDLAELRKLRKQNDEAKMIPVLDKLSKSFYQIGDYPKALNAVNVALAFREKLRINNEKSQDLELRGLIYDKLGQKVEALENLTWAGCISKVVNESDEAKAANLAQGLGLDVGAALKNYRSLWLARESGDTQTEVKSLLELGNLYAKDRNYETASKYYELLRASLTAEISVFYKKLGKFAEAQKNMDEALQAFKSLDYLLYFSFMNRSAYHDKISAVQQ